MQHEEKVARPLGYFLLCSLALHLLLWHERGRFPALLSTVPDGTQAQRVTIELSQRTPAPRPTAPAARSVPPLPVHRHRPTPPPALRPVAARPIVVAQPSLLPEPSYPHAAPPIRRSTPVPSHPTVVATPLAAATTAPAPPPARVTVPVATPPAAPGKPLAGGGQSKAIPLGPQPRVELPAEVNEISVRVELTIHVSGEISVHLLTSSGNPGLDKSIAAALSGWRWRPALKDGQAVESTRQISWSQDRS